MDQSKMVSQALAVANNYINTGRSALAFVILQQVHKVDQTYKLPIEIIDSILDQVPLDLSQWFGEHWLGQCLEQKSIEIFCDQGMGDTINMLRYLKVMKERWNCKIVLNCYAFYDEFRRFMECVPFVDVFTNIHEKCDYTTNILSIAALLNNLPLDVYYPAHYKELLASTKIPPQPKIGPFQGSVDDTQFKVGIAWQSNLNNELSKIKSIPLEMFSRLKANGVSLYSLLPNQKNLPDWLIETQIIDLMDTAQLIESMDLVISVDTVVLHLAGTLSKRTLGLIPYDADPRWEDSNGIIWYFPYVHLFRQINETDWDYPLNFAKNCLENLLKN